MVAAAMMFKMTPGLCLAAVCVATQSHARPPDTSLVFHLFSHRGFAHGCPIGATTLLTSRHVATDESGGMGLRGVAMVWSDDRGASGSAWMQDYDARRDLALMQFRPPVTTWYARAAEPPTIGERVTVVGYDFGARLRPKILSLKVVNAIALHLVLSEAAGPGFSGSCVLNQQNEVVGVFQWGVGTLGVASGVWGEWGSVDWIPPS